MIGAWMVCPVLKFMRKKGENKKGKGWMGRGMHLFLDELFYLFYCWLGIIQID